MVGAEIDTERSGENDEVGGARLAQHFSQIRFSDVMKYLSVHSTSTKSILHWGLALLLVVGISLTGCDSGGTGVGGEDSATISGTVTDNNSSGSSSTNTLSSKASSQNGVEAATVTAVSVGADGSTRPLEGEATTDANGEFSITVEGEGDPDVIRLNADGEGDFSSSVIVDVNGQGQVQAQPMTAETKAEADVYVEAKGEGSASSHDEGTTAADVALYVNADAAADINAGQTQATEVATAIASSVEAESQANSEAEDGASADAVAEVKASLYTDLQSSLAAASNADARAQAVADFEEGMATLYTEAGGSEESQGESRQTGTSIMIEFSAEASSNAELGLRRQAELLRAEATARAEEAIFEAEGASSATMDALVNARQQLSADLRAATSTSAMVEAHSGYRTEVKTQMESTFGLSTEAIGVAETEIAGNVDALFSSLADISAILNSAVEVAINSYNTFYAEAQTAAQASFEATIDSDASAEAAARALVLMSAHSHAS